MLFAKRLRILALLALLTLTLTGCGTKHYLHTAGQTGVTLGRERIDGMLPDDKGNLVRGSVKLEPGALIILPKTADEVMQRLRAAGVTIKGGE